MMRDLSRLTKAVETFKGIELRGGLVAVRLPADARGSTTVVCMFEKQAEAKLFAELAEALPEMLEALTNAQKIEAFEDNT